MKCLLCASVLLDSGDSVVTEQSEISDFMDFVFWWSQDGGYKK